MKNWLRGVGVVAVMAVVSGCSDKLMSTTDALAPVGGLRSVDANGGKGSPFNPVSKKYSDNGAKPATGRSGSATISARALLGADGNTVIEVKTGQLDNAAVGIGNIAKIQLKAINGTGVAIRTQNFNNLTGGGTWSHTTDQLGHNAPIQVQANVRDIDPKRTDVVTVTANVKKRPDMAVESVINPARVHVNQAITITALVSEINGDVGGTGSCVLFVNGTQADQAPVVWVDAGTSVTCQFAHTFTAAGDYDLKVAFTGVVPGDWSLANNERSGTIEVVLPVIDLSWNASVNSWSSTSNQTRNYSYNDCYYYYYSCYYGSQQQVQSWSDQNSNLYYYASTYQAAAASPMNVDFSMTSGGTIGSLNAQALNVGEGCAFLYDGASGTQGNICTYGSATTAQFQKNGGMSTYYSQTWYSNYSRYTYWYSGYYVCGYDYDGYAYYCWYSYPYTYEYYNSGYWTDNYSNAWGAPQFSLGSSVATSFNITDANGLQFKAAGSFAVSETPFNNSWSYCDSYSYYYNYQDCYSGSSQGIQKNGWGYGYGESAP